MREEKDYEREEKDYEIITRGYDRGERVGTIGLD